jgi:hypothetical protein
MTNVSGSYVNFSNTDLSYATLSGSKFDRGKFQNSKLFNSDLVSSNLEEANMKGCNLKGADLESSKMLLCGINTGQTKGIVAYNITSSTRTHNIHIDKQTYCRLPRTFRRIIDRGNPKIPNRYTCI